MSSGESEVEGLLDNPVVKNISKYGDSMARTQEALSLLGAGQPYNPVKLPHPIGGHYSDKE